MNTKANKPLLSSSPVKIMLGLVMILMATSVHEMRAFAVAGQFSTESGRSSNGIRAELINLNPDINKWFLLKLKSYGRTRIHHLENTIPANTLKLTEGGLEIITPGNSISMECKLWKGRRNNLATQRFSSHINPYKALCDGLVYLRLKRSSKTKLSMTEWGTSILRKSKYGEAIINAFKPWLVSLKAESASSTYSNSATGSMPDTAGYPKRPSIIKNTKSNTAVEHSLGVQVHHKGEGLHYGEWYQSKLHKGIYVNLFTVDQIPKNIMNSYKDRVDPIDEDDLDKLVYFMAYDLDKYAANYAVGTLHPKRDRSPIRMPGIRDLNRTLVPIGSIPPYQITKSVGVFIGGFKRRHSTMRLGPHRGKVFGYIENGVEWQKLSPGLATLYSTKDGYMDIAPWPSSVAEQEKLKSKIVGARQNGVMLMEKGVPSPLINKKAGNWSADAKGKIQTLRSVTCIQERGGKRFLLFGAITSGTPSTVARLTQAFHCKSAMQMDMNAYMYMHNALYSMQPDKSFKVEYLHTEMEFPKGLKRHRFIMDNNERDFFYVYRRGAQVETAEE